ncbi:MAG: DUF3102 domain-containing protein, partial [Ruminococcus sp.]|nr:DUF3102 domain-containing protein [Ruminococcus sp.]
MSTELAKQEAMVITERIRANEWIAVNAVCTVGKDLRRMKIEKLYIHLGYDSFDQYAEQEFGYKRRAAYQYISVYEKLGEEFVQTNAHLGITKLLELTQIDAEDRSKVMEENDLAGMTTNEVKKLISEYKQQGEQLSMLENANKAHSEQFDEDQQTIENLRERLETLEFEKSEVQEKYEQIKVQNDKLLNEIEELESRPIEAATIPEPEVKEVIKEVPDEKAIAARDSEISHLRKKIKEQEEERKKLETSYEAQLTKIRSSQEQTTDA